MKINTVRFIGSSPDNTSLPKPDRPEYAFVGRSNVGKSSLINRLCGKKGIAKTSSTPGKTQLINHFMINEAWYLVDLPGYGYAKVSKNQRRKFETMLKGYLTQRQNLLTVFVLVDSRIPPQDLDVEFIEYLGMSQIPLTIVFTKIDKLNYQELQKSIAQFENRLLESWEELPQAFYTSSQTGDGTEEILEYIEETNQVME